MEKEKTSMPAPCGLRKAAIQMKRNISILGAAMLSVAILFSSGCGTEAASTGSSARAEQGEKFPAFTTQDLAGNTVTEEIFARKKVTVINIWGTFCPPCIGEMPELSEWAGSMPADVQLVGIVCDVGGAGDKETFDEARKIMQKAGGDFVNLIPNGEIMKYLEKVEAVPTTIFVDEKGRILGEPVIGADVAQYKARVREYLQ